MRPVTPMTKEEEAYFADMCKSGTAFIEQTLRHWSDEGYDPDFVRMLLPTLVFFMCTGIADKNHRDALADINDTLKDIALAIREGNPR